MRHTRCGLNSSSIIIGKETLLTERKPSSWSNGNGRSRAHLSKNSLVTRGGSVVGSRVVSVLDSGTKGPGSKNRSHDTVG